MLAMNATLEYPKRHPISAKEYLRMGAAGVFSPEARLELIEGEIVEMAPIDPPHASCVARLNEFLVKRASGPAFIWGQSPVVISDRSVPQPDIAVLRRRADYYSAALPATSDVLLAIEVSDTTLRIDLRIKVPLYARSGIAEVWVVDVNKRVIHVFREPGAEGYGTSFIAKDGDRVACEVLPDAWIDVAEIFPG
jgi:Uma2 family endonuclease